MSGDSFSGGKFSAPANTPTSKQSGEDVLEFRHRTMKLAKTTIAFLERRLDGLELDEISDTEGLRSDARTKELLTIAKAIGSLEDLINTMDASINESSLYPQDALEFHKQIEERIRRFSNL